MINKRLVAAIVAIGVLATGSILGSQALAQQAMPAANPSIAIEGKDIGADDMADQDNHCGQNSGHDTHHWDHHGEDDTHHKDMHGEDDTHHIGMHGR
ncbi:MAG: hypothetical protein ACE5IA_06325 [Dehalococcoidia bacterium]